MRTRNPHRLRELMLERLDRVDQDNQRRDAVTDEEMADAMTAYGGSFVKALGVAWYRADDINRAKILAAWPDECRDYRDVVRLKRRQAAHG